MCLFVDCVVLCNHRHADIGKFCKTAQFTDSFDESFGENFTTS